ncbi:HesA/MoeB/ThiF family protein [Geobacter sp. OR-1]|uniref:HesA/MoeB/ThiF family protein n=1 Tax=Geobacter sp. OR-1 TaxID=1266765 RepID=UPI0005AB15DF|nr:HesA/MoeB/ThiF family protein [Geobacter sp. OR-1]
MTTLHDYLREQATEGILPWTRQRRAMVRFGCTCYQVEEAALGLGILPARYQRNRETVSIEDQLTLLRSRVAVIGCGGLGGYVVEELARLGVGQLVVIDPDCFEEHNLNRQLFSLPANLGQAKVAAAQKRVAALNPAVTLLPLQETFNSDNGPELLAGVQLAVDCLDSIPVRLELAEVCEALNIPLVHGAIAGWYGQVTTQFPGDRTLQTLYQGRQPVKGVEQQLGNPSFTPAVIAGLEVAEACKVLLGKGETLRRRLLSIDLRLMQLHETTLTES